MSQNIQPANSYITIRCDMSALEQIFTLAQLGRSAFMSSNHDPEHLRYPRILRRLQPHAPFARGLAGAAEWPALRAILPDVNGLRVIDLGCRYGWFCRWARQNGAATVLGLDVSERMLAQARTMTIRRRDYLCHGRSGTARSAGLVLRSRSAAALDRAARQTDPRLLMESAMPPLLARAYHVQKVSRELAAG
jgi:SAM-dependent methyltransferase